MPLPKLTPEQRRVSLVVRVKPANKRKLRTVATKEKTSDGRVIDRLIETLP